MSELDIWIYHRDPLGERIKRMDKSLKTSGSVNLTYGYIIEILWLNELDVWMYHCDPLCERIRRMDTSMRNLGEQIRRTDISLRSSV